MENVYYLNKKGREFVGCEKVVTKTIQYEHTLMRNDIYIHFGCPKMWQSEYVIPTPDFTIKTDAVFSVKGVQYFLEVDRAQKMTKNLNKLERYKEFKEMELWQKRNGGRFPVVLFYTMKESRKEQFKLKNPGIELLVYTKKDLI
jgi:hypothetical protein